MLRWGCLLSFLVIGMTLDLASQDRAYGRSVVMTERGIVATSHYLASQAGAQVLARGGTAMDAAIAANAVLGVTEPMMNGIGGDLFLIYWDAKAGKLYGLNASGWSPRKLTPEFLAHLLSGSVVVEGVVGKDGKISNLKFISGPPVFHNAMPREGIHSVTVPGVVDGWSQAHKRF